VERGYLRPPTQRHHITQRKCDTEKRGCDPATAHSPQSEDEGDQHEWCDQTLRDVLRVCFQKRVKAAEMFEVGCPRNGGGDVN